MALKIACGQIEIIAGRPDLNTKKILHHMDMACQNGIDILLLPELAVPGYFLGDLWEQTAFIEDCAAYGDEIIAATENCGELCVIFGNIAVDNSKRNEDGRARKYNAAFAAQHGRLLTNGTLPYDFIVKNALPNYREFDDNRHFYGLRQLALELDKQVAGLHQPLTVTAHGETVKGEDVFAVVLDTYIIAVDKRDAGFLRGTAEKPVPFAVFVDAEGGAGDVA